MLRYETEGPVATLTLDDPARRNPLSNEVCAQMAETVHRLRDDESIRVLVVTGAGDRAFSAGGDLSGGFIEDPIATQDERAAFADLFRALRRCGRPTIARVNGDALAGGFGLAMGCDFVIAAEHARFGMPEVKVGLWPMTITAVVQRSMPRKAALQMMMTGELIDAGEAHRLGLVTVVTAKDQLDEAVSETVARLLAMSPAVLKLGKDAFFAVEDMSFDAALDHLLAGLTAVGMTEDAIEGIKAFQEKRAPDWKGR